MGAFAKLAVFLLFMGLLSACKSTQTVVTVSYEGEGTITESTKINCGGICQATYSVSTANDTGYDIQLYAAPAEGFEFFGWENCGSASPCKVRIQPECVKFGTTLGGAIICTQYKTGQKSEQAIFVPEGSVRASAWYNESYCMITSAGELKCKGTMYDPVAQPVSNPTAVSISYSAGCVLDDSGALCWGNAAAAHKPTLTAPQAIAVIDEFACVIDQDQVKCWGYPSTNNWLPPIPSMSHPKRLWVEGVWRNNICAQDDTGAHCWGMELQGQSRAPAINHPIDISAEHNTSCALTANGVQCWGAPYDVTALNNAINNASQISDPSDYGMCAVDHNGAHCTDRDRAIRALNPVFQAATSVAVRDDSLCSLTSAGPQCAWLNESQSKYYSLSAPGSDVLLAVASPDKCTLTTTDNKLNCITTNDAWLAEFKNFTVPMPNANTLAVMPWGDMWCVGAESGLYCRRSSRGAFPEMINHVTPPKNLTGVIDLDIKDYVACAVHSKGVTCWGDNSMGQLEVPRLSHPTKVAVGRFHACALDDTGVVCWGEKATPPTP